jgi:hypothetical protein
MCLSRVRTDRRPDQSSAGPRSGSDAGAPWRGPLPRAAGRLQSSPYAHSRRLRGFPNFAAGPFILANRAAGTLNPPEVLKPVRRQLRVRSPCW